MKKRRGPIWKVRTRVHRWWWSTLLHGRYMEFYRDGDGEVSVRRTKGHEFEFRLWRLGTNLMIKAHDLRWKVFRKELPCGCHSALGALAIQVDCPEHGLTKWFAALGIADETTE